MFQTIGTFIDNLIFIMGGIILLTQLKKLNKPYLKWIALGMIFCGILLSGIEIIELME